MILALIQRFLGIEIANRDVFVNAAGGADVAEPAADLALLAALVSSATRRAVSGRWVVMGEIGLSGEIRAVARVETRLREAARLGFRTALLPAGPTPVEVAGIRCVAAESVEHCVDELFGRAAQIG